LNVTVLIPAYNPGAPLVDLVARLQESAFETILVVNDGSSAASGSVFQALAAFPKVILLKHEQNKGKGAALKTGFRYALSFLPESAGLVAVDADGQHSCKDASRIAEAVLAHPENLILGVRSFDKNVPPQRLIGNKITAFLTRVLFGLDVQDTQTGLRGFPFGILETMLEIPYDRYEYEMDMLFVCHQKRIPITQIGIETIYMPEPISHFNPLLDSFKVYSIFLRHLFPRR
jgi:glycosyltransferase involved in cell wall biosynthesis